MISKFLAFLTNPDKRFVVSLEFTILALVLFYFVVLFFSEYQTLGLKNPIIEISPLIKQIADMALYLMLALLTFELVLKYMKIRNWRKFLRKHWLDVAMVILIPIFSGIKILKTVGLVKKIKIAKYGIKAADKTQKKIRKNRSK